METTRSPLGLDYGYNTYSLTINVSPKKILKGIKFEKYTYDNKKAVILDLLYFALSANGIHQFDSRWEDTKSGIPHIHVILYASEEQVLSVQRLIHERLGFPRVPPSVVCFYDRTTVDKKYWIDYMTKEEESPLKLCPKNVCLKEDSEGNLIYIYGSKNETSH